MIGLGPFSLATVLFFAAALLAWATARVLARYWPDAAPRAIDALMLDAVLAGALAARMGYIVQWWQEYSAAPMSMLAIADGGFSWWVGTLAALALVWWKTRERQALRRPACIGLLAGVLVWWVASSAAALLQRETQALPDLELTTLDGRPVQLSAFAGQPVVLNLWASWCPPCRREMPVFQQAEAEFPDVVFVLANQGESTQQASSFLARQHLAFRHALLDPSSQAMRLLGTRGLPTTLFFDAQGRLVDSHLGEVTWARLKSAVLRQRAQSPQSLSDKEQK